MAFLSSDELSALHVQMAHDAEVAARPPEPSYPLAPTYVSSPETAAPATAYPLAPTITALPAPDSSAYGPISPYVTPETAPAEYSTPYTPPEPPPTWDYQSAQRALNTGAAAPDNNYFTPNWDVFNQPAEPEPFFGSGGFYRDEGGDNAAFGLGGLTGLARRGLDAATVAGNIGAYVNPVTQPAAIARAAAGNNPFLDPLDRQQSILETTGTAARDLTSGNALVKDLGGPDLSNLPYGLNYVTDTALAPATWITAGAGSEAPIIGSVFKGGLGRRLLGETAVGAGTLFGGEKAAEKAAEYTDNPYLIGGAGVLGGAVTGLGVLGGIKAAERVPGAAKAADRALTGLDARINEPAGSQLVTAANEARPGTTTVYHGTAGPLRGGMLEPDAFVTTDRNVAAAIAEAEARLNGGKPSVLAFEAEPGALKPTGVDDLASTAGGAQLVNDPAKLRPLSLAAKLSDETGALDMGAVGDIANAARHGNPVGRAIARVAPGGVEVTAPAVDTAPRIGELLHARVLEGDYKPAQALRVGRNLERRAASVANQIDAEAAPAWKALGPTFKDKAGNVFLKNVAPSPAEVDAGLPGALAVRVVEKPEEYALTAAQKAATKKLGDLTGSVANERDALGATVNRITGEEGDIFQHRKALKNAAGEELNQPGGGGGSRLAIGKDKTRIFDDPAEAVKAGVVYADPKVAFRENVEGGLKKAVNAHVKSLLEPFGQTAADRVSPQLRAQVDGLRQKVQSLKATGARLGDRTDRIIDDFLKDPGANLDNLRDVLPARVGANAVGKQGVNFGKTRPELNQTLLDIRKQLNDLAPAWRKEIAASKSPAPGRVTIPQAIAPALIGTDFDKQTAARIISQYGGGIRVGNNVLTTSIPGVKKLNALLTPINATLDFSVTLNQLAILGVSNKRDFVKNLGNSMLDMVNDRRYNAWLADPKVRDSARWVTIYGEAGDQGDFLARTLQRVPIFAQTQKQFARFGNRMRVDAFNSIADSAAKSAGRQLDDTALEQIGRAVDRLSGVSMSRATDAERLAQFAPNFFRSIIETTAHAAADGGLEGQIARQYLKNYAALGAGLVTATALAQNRDLADVLNPFDKRAWDRGQIKINPNWMTIRMAGQDVAVFGTYDSAMKLLVVGADSAFRAVNERDAKQLFDALGYAGSSKGSPVVKFITDLIKGETFTHKDPLNPAELLKRLLPISSQQAVQAAQEGKGLKEIAIETGLSAIGAKSNPVTDYEKKDQQAMDAYGKHWDELSPVEQNALKAVPGSPAATYQSTNPDAVAATTRRTADSAARAEKQQEIDNKYIASGATAPASYEKGKAWRDEYNTLRFAANEIYKKDSRDHPYTGPESKHPMRAAMDEWGKIIDANTFGTKTDWDKVDAWEAANPDKAKLVDEYLHDPNRPNKDDTPIVTAKKEVSKKLGDAGFFDLRDDLWKAINAQSPAPGYVPGQGYYDWRAAQIERVTQEMIASGIPPATAPTKAETYIDTKFAPVSKFNDYYKTTILYPWVNANPELAETAVQWGYLYPDTKIQKFFQWRSGR